MQVQNKGELAKTAAGRLRISAASDRLDKTLADMGERLMGQGEMSAEAEVPHQPQEAPQAFVPMPEHLEPEPVRDVDVTGGDIADRVESRDLDIADGGEAIGDMENGMEISAVQNSYSGNGSVSGKLAHTDDDSYPSRCKDQDGYEPRDESKPSVAEQDQIVEDHELRDLLKALTKETQEEAKTQCRDILQLVKSLGGDSRRYLKERRKGIKAIVAEIYSPPRVTAATKLLPELGCIPGFALDLTTTDENGQAWDFDLKEMREKARLKMRVEKPLLLVGSPMCKAYSAWQRINAQKRDPKVVER